MVIYGYIWLYGNHFATKALRIYIPINPKGGVYMCAVKSGII